jgi:dTDP-4-dehydrorhamnose 3,5-epimerase
MISTIKKTIDSKKIAGMKITVLDTFQDERGEIWTIYSDKHTNLSFVEDKITISRFGVLRGFHGDSKTAKLISCLSGRIQLSVADLRKNSITYGNVETFTISAKDPKVIEVPAGCINAHLCLSDKCIFHYKWSEKYAGPNEQVTVSWNDPDLNVDWNIKNPILSERDKKGTPSKEIYL